MSTLEDTKHLPAWIWPRAAYVHVPFCAHHCGYCDFAVAAGQDHLQETYLDALEAEIATLGTPHRVETLFLGGGTPTHLSVEGLDRLLCLLCRWLPISARVAGAESAKPRGAPDRGVEDSTPATQEDSGEFTVEANPESLTEEKVAVLSRHGVNRVSLGAQSFHPHLLRVLERVHSPEAVLRAVERVRRSDMQVSLDLIFGVPGQSTAEWAADLGRALALKPDHVSTYGLTYEKGTRLWKQRRAGKLRQLDEEAELDLYRLAIDTLEAAGFEHYEISNFALPGHRSRHNQVYWANEAYFGFGLGAARYVRGVREVNTRDLSGYLHRTLAGESVTQSSEKLDDHERARETMAVQLRRTQGIDRPAFRAQTGRELEAVASERLGWLVEAGFLRDDGRSVALTRQGQHVADAIIERLL